MWTIGRSTPTATGGGREVGAYNDRLLFVHIPKTGGTSIKRYLWDHLPGVRGQRPASWGDDFDSGGLPIGHVPLRDIERFTGRTPDSFERILAVIRNPYEQQVSQWLFWRERYAIGHRHPHDLCAASHSDVNGWLEDPLCDFHLWYEERFSDGDPAWRKSRLPEERYATWGGFYPYWLADKTGRFPDNLQMLEFSTLADDFPGAVADFTEAAELPRMNAATLRFPVPAYYSQRGAALVEMKFPWAFGTVYGKLDPLTLRPT